MLKSFLSMLGVCTHINLTFPQSPRRIGPLNRFRRQEKATCTCLDCGAEFEYDWKQMLIGKRIYPPPHQRPTLDRQEAR